MDIKQLYYFVTIVEEKTISGAARKLHISQPPLSTAIKQLEHELGTTLFQRGNRRIYLTDSGKLLYSKIIAGRGALVGQIKNVVEGITLFGQLLGIFGRQGDILQTVHDLIRAHRDRVERIHALE